MFPPNDDMKVASVEDQSALAVQATPESYVRRFCMVFLLNLPVPFFWGVMVNEKRNTFIMLAGCAMLLGLGRFICSGSRRVGFSLTAGGLVVAITQLFPILQMMVGLLVVEGFGAATGLVKVSEYGPVLNGISPWACLVFTLLTGLILMGIALVLGEIMRWLFFRMRAI